MGSSSSKYAKFVKVCLITNKKFYYPGEIIKGQIYIIVTQRIPPNQLYLTLNGEESVDWQQGSDDSKTSYSLKETTYFFQFMAQRFFNGLEAGQYKVPLSLLLPSMITGSFQYSRSNFIKYTLQVGLTILEEEKQIFYQNNLTIIQKPRFYIGPQSFTNPINCVSCCCCDNGIVVLRLQTNKNYVVNGQVVRLKVSIDNKRGQGQINMITLTLQQRICQTVSEFSKTQFCSHQETLFQSNLVIGEKQTKEFEVNCRIPDSVKYTAIGRLIGRYYIIRLSVQTGVFSVKSCFLHLIVNSNTPDITQNEPLNQPIIWKPFQLPEVKCMSLPPYMYKPLSSIPFLNMPKEPHITSELNSGVNFPDPKTIYKYVVNNYGFHQCFQFALNFFIMLSSDTLY